MLVHKEPWCSGLTCLPVTQKIAGSNPVGSVSFYRKNILNMLFRFIYFFALRLVTLQIGIMVKVIPSSEIIRYLDPKRSSIEANLHGHPILLAEIYVGSAIGYNSIQ